MKNALLLRTVLGSLLVIAGTTPSWAQQTPPQPSCTRAEHKHFDFWVGDWNVFNAQGQQIGTNRISRIAAGCALLEEWQAANGPGGKSLNFFEAADSQWHQVWVGGDGVVLRIAGGLKENAMQMAGADRKTPRGTVRDRITWTPQSDGAVEQRWDISTDGGATWQTGFLGTYRKK
jgi:hypothetical protein